MSNVITLRSKEYRINEESLNELARMSRELHAYLNEEKNARRRRELNEIIDYLGDVLATVERNPRMTNIIELAQKGIHRDDEAPHIDAYGQLMLIGICSDLRRHRDSQTEQAHTVELDDTLKRLSELLERYEP